VKVLNQPSASFQKKELEKHILDNRRTLYKGKSTTETIKTSLNSVTETSDEKKVRELTRLYDVKTSTKQDPTDLFDINAVFINNQQLFINTEAINSTTQANYVFVNNSASFSGPYVIPYVFNNFVYPSFGRLVSLSYFDKVFRYKDSNGNERLGSKLVGYFASVSCSDGTYLKCSANSESISSSYFVNYIYFNDDYTKITFINCYEDDYVSGPVESARIMALDDADYTAQLKILYCDKLRNLIFSQTDYKFRVIKEGSAKQMC